MQESVIGIILLETPFQESSKILQVLTPKYGLIGVLAKGVKSSKSKLASKTGKFTYATFHLIYKPGKLSTLIGVDIIEPFTNIHQDIALISYMSYLCELTYQVAKQHVDAHLFELLITALTKMNQGMDPMVLMEILEVKYLDYLGIHLEVDGCVKCGNPKDIVTLSASSGGYLCSHCYQDEKIVLKKTIQTLRNYYYVNLKSIESISISSEVKKEIYDFLKEYYDSYTGISLKSKQFLEKMIFNA